MKKLIIEYIIVNIGIILIVSIILAMLAGIVMIFMNTILTPFDKNITYGMSFLIVLLITIIKKIL